MSSFIKKLTGVTTGSTDVDEDAPLPRRSDGRMKTYSSASDARAWCRDEEERRHYILDIVRRDYQKNNHHLPIEDILRFLRQNESGDCKALQEENQRLRRMLESETIIAERTYTTHNLQEQKPQPVLEMQKIKEMVPASTQTDKERGCRSRRESCTQKLVETTVCTAIEDSEKMTSTTRKSPFNKLEQSIIPRTPNVFQEKPCRSKNESCTQKLVQTTIPITLEVVEERSCKSRKKSVNKELVHTPLIEELEDPIRPCGKRCSSDFQKEDNVGNTNLEDISEEPTSSYNAADELYFNGSVTDATSITTIPKENNFSPKQRISKSGSPNSVRKLVELELQLLTKKKNTKQNMDKLKAAFTCLKKELDSEKAKTATLLSQSKEILKVIENLKKENECIRKENTEDKKRIIELTTSLEKVFQEHAKKCECADNVADGDMLEKSVENIRSLNQRFKELENEVQDYKTQLMNQKEEHQKLLCKLKEDEEFKSRFEELALKAMNSKNDLISKISTTRNSLNNVVEKVASYEKKIEEQKEREKNAAESINLLKNELKNAQSIIKCLQEELTALKSNNEYLKTTLEHVQSAAKENLAKVASENEVLNEASRQYEKLYNDLTKIHSVQKETMIKLKEELQTLKEKIRKISPSGDFTEIDQMRAEIVTLKAEIQRLQSEIDLKDKEHEIEISQFKKMSKEIEEEKRVSKDLSETNTFLIEKIAKLQEHNEHLNEKFKQLEEDHVNEISSLREENDALKSKIELVDNSNEERRSIIDENDSLKQQIEHLKVEIDRHENKFQEKDIEIEKLTKERDNLLKSLDDQTPVDEICLKYKQQNEALQAERQNILHELEDKEAQLQMLQEKNATTISENQTEITENQKSINELTLTLQQKENKIGELVGALQDCNAENENLKLKLTDVQDNAENLKVTINTDVADTSPEITIIVKELTDRLQSEKLKNSELEEQLNKCITFNMQSLEEKITELQAENKSLKSKLAESSNDNKLPAQFEDLMKQNEDCTNLVSTLKDQYDKYIKDLLKQSDRQTLEKIFDVKIPEKSDKGAQISAKLSHNSSSTCPCSRRRFTSSSLPESAFLNVPAYVSVRPDEAIERVTKITQLENVLFEKERRTKEKVQTLLKNVEAFKAQLELEKKRKSELLNTYKTCQMKSAASKTKKCKIHTSS